MNQKIELQVHKRDVTGTLPSMKDRHNKRIPCVVYGLDKPNLHISVDEKEFHNKIKDSFYNTVITLKNVDLKINQDVLINHVQRHVVNDNIIHIDFLYLDSKVKNIKCRIPVKFVNASLSPGLKRGGFLNVISKKVLVQCDRTNIPIHLEVNLSGREAKKTIFVKDIDVSNIPDLQILTRASKPIASIIGKSTSTASSEAVDAAE